MRYAKIGALSAFAGVCAAGGALAQQSFTPQALGNAYLSQAQQLPTEDVTLSVQEMYDSNVAESDYAEAVARGIHQSDEIFSPGVGLNIVLPKGMSQFFLRGQADYWFYSRNHKFNQAVVSVLGGASTYALCQDTLTGDFENQRNDTQIAPTLVGVRNTTATGGVQLQAACGQKYGLAPSVSVGERWQTNSSSYFEPTDYRMLTATANLAFRRPVLGSVGIYGEFNEVNFDHDKYFDGSSFVNNGYDIYTAGIHYDHKGTYLETVIDLAYTDLKPFNPIQRDFQGVSYALDVHYHAGPGLTAYGLISRAAIPTNLPFATYSISSTYDLGASYYVTQRIELGLQGSITHDDYHNSPAVPLFLVDNQTFYQIQARADVTLTRNLRLGVGVAEVHRDTDLPGFSFSATRVWARLTAKFGT